MLSVTKAILAISASVMISATGTLAEQSPPTFPTFSADNPQRVGIVSKLSPEGRAILAGYLDEADTHGFFPPNLVASGQEDFGIILYVLSSWEEAKELPPNILPPVAAAQIEKIDKTYYRYSIPARKPDGEVFVMMFYVAGNQSAKALACLAQDLVLTLDKAFDPNATAPCVKGS